MSSSPVGEAKRRPKQNTEPIGASSEEEPDVCGFYVRTEGNRVVLQFEREINFLQLTGKDSVELGRALITQGQTVRRRRGPGKVGDA